MKPEINIDAILRKAKMRADMAYRAHGPHPTVDFAACRVAEEAGELVQAATSVTRPPDFNRQMEIEEEAIDTIAMVIRLLREFPEGCDE